MYNQSTPFFSLLFALGLFTASNSHAQQDLAHHQPPAQHTAMVDDSKQVFSIYPEAGILNLSGIYRFQRELVVECGKSGMGNRGDQRRKRQDAA